jgi:hypothetical protein
LNYAGLFHVRINLAADVVARVCVE